LQQVHNGTQDNIELAIYNNGTLTNADGNVLVNITDADSGTVLITNASATNLPPLGIYSYTLTPDVTQTNRVIKIVWSYSIGGKTTSQSDFIEIVTPYALVSDIIQYYNLGARPSDPNYKSTDEILMAEKIARTQIDSYTNQNFGKRYGSQEQFGSGSDAIELVERMLTIDTVKENGITVIDYTQNPAYNNFGFDVEITPTGKAIRILTGLADVRYDNQVDPTIVYYGRFRTNARYFFTGQIGYNYVPQDIKLAAILLAGDYLSRDYEWRNKYLNKVDLAEISFEMHQGAFNGTGNVIVDQILDDYRNLGIIVI
jgi:hypothetical protein